MQGLYKSFPILNVPGSQTESETSLITFLRSNSPHGLSMLIQQLIQQNAQQPTSHFVPHYFEADTSLINSATNLGMQRYL